MMLNEMDSIFGDFVDSQDAGTFKRRGEDLLVKYNDPKFDKLAETRRNVNDVKVQMSENMNKLLENHNDLEELEEEDFKSENLDQEDSNEKEKEEEKPKKKKSNHLFTQKIRKETSLSFYSLKN